MRFILVTMSLGVIGLSLNGCFTISDDDSNNGGTKNDSGGSPQNGGSGGSNAGSGTLGGSDAGGRMGHAGTLGFLPRVGGSSGTGAGGDTTTTSGSAGQAESGGTGGGTGGKGGSGGSGASGGKGGSHVGGTGGTSGTSGSTSEPGTCDGYSQKLQDCALVDLPLDCPSLGDDPSRPCYFGCYEAAACGTLSDYYCNDAQNSLADCLNACDTFSCGNGETVPSSYVCDGGNDCSNRADEKGCVAPPIFHCATGGTTVDGSYRCDGYPDCSDGSDEESCPSLTCPRPTAPKPGAACADAMATLASCGLFPEAIPSCIDRTEYQACQWECFAHGSCGNLTGYYCGTTAEGAAIQRCLDGCGSMSDEFPCTTGTDVVPGSYVCDEGADCKDGSDEANCAFKCATGKQSVAWYVTCDGSSDCADGSDEVGCSPTCN